MKYLLDTNVVVRYLTQLQLVQLQTELFDELQFLP